MGKCSLRTANVFEGDDRKYVCCARAKESHVRQQIYVVFEDFYRQEKQNSIYPENY